MVAQTMGRRAMGDYAGLVAAACIALMACNGCGGQPEVGLVGSAVVPSWAAGYEPRRVDMRLDIAPDTASLADLQRSGIRSAPVLLPTGGRLHLRFAADYDPRVVTATSERVFEFEIRVSQPSAVVGMELWLDGNTNSRVDTGDVLGEFQGGPAQAKAADWLSCGIPEGAPLVVWTPQ